jgi:AcrR family transcriptional regulator
VAADVADEQGIDALTLAAVAGRLGVSVPSLYRHVDGLEGVRHLLCLRSLDELADIVTRSAVARTRGDALASFAAAYRDYARAAPGRYATTVSAPRDADGDHARAASRVLHPLLALIASYGLDEVEQVDAARFLRSGLHGFVTLEQAGGFGLPQNIDESFRQLVAALDRSLTTWSVSE